MNETERSCGGETELERRRHICHDALRLLDAESVTAGDERFAGAARAILRGGSSCRVDSGEHNGDPRGGEDAATERIDIERLARALHKQFRGNYGEWDRDEGRAKEWDELAEDQEWPLGRQQWRQKAEAVLVDGHASGAARESEASLRDRAAGP